MKIKRMINGEEVEIELTQEEIAEAKADTARRIQDLLKAHAYHIDFPKWHRVVDEDDIDMICENVMNGRE